MLRSSSSKERHSKRSVRCPSKYGLSYPKEYVQAHGLGNLCLQSCRFHDQVRILLDASLSILDTADQNYPHTEQESKESLLEMPACSTIPDSKKRRVLPSKATSKAMSHQYRSRVSLACISCVQAVDRVFHRISTVLANTHETCALLSATPRPSTALVLERKNRVRQAIQWFEEGLDVDEIASRFGFVLFDVAVVNVLSS